MVKRWFSPSNTALLCAVLLCGAQTLKAAAFVSSGFESLSFGRGVHVGLQKALGEGFLAKLETGVFTLDNAAVKVGNNNEMNFSSTLNFRVMGGGLYEVYSERGVSTYLGLGAAYLLGDKALIQVDTVGGYAQIGAKWVSEDGKKGFYCEQRIFEGFARAKEIQNHPNLFSTASVVVGLLYGI